MVSDDKTPEALGGEGSVPPAGDWNQQTPAAQPQFQSYTPQADQAATGAQLPQAQSYAPQATPGQAATPAYTQGQAATQAFPQGQSYAPQQPASPAGYPAGGGFGGQPPVGGAPAGGGNKKKFILIGAIAGGLVLLLIIGSIVINVINGNSYGPEATVRTYLSAIASGNATEANKLVDPNLKKGKDLLLNNKVLKGAKERIKNPKVTKVSRSGDSAYAYVSYSLDGTVYEDTLQLSNQGKQSVFFDKWKVDKPLLSKLYVRTSQGTEASVSGVSVDFGDEAQLEAYPAVYTIAAPKSDFFEAEDVEFVAGTGSKAAFEGVDIELKPTKALQEEVQKQLNAFIDDCAKKTEEEIDRECSMSPFFWDFLTVTKVVRTVSKYPTVKIDETGRTFQTTGGEVKYAVTGTDYGNRPITGAYKSTASWGFYGQITIEDGKVIIDSF